MRFPRGCQSGFSLIELVIAIVLIGLLGAVGSSMIFDSFDATRMVNANQSTMAKARYVMERLEREIREIRYASSDTDPPSYCDSPTNTKTNQYCISAPATLPTTLTILPAATGNSLTFSNGTGATTTITGSGTSVTLNGNVLSNDVTELKLSFFDINESATPPTAATLRLVKIDLKIKGDESPEFTQRSRIALRNQ